MKIRQLLLLIVQAIVSVLYFYSTRIRISFIIFLRMNDSVCHLGKLKSVGFKGLLCGCPGSIGPFSKYTIG